MSILADQLKKFRAEKNLSQDALAEQLFISRQAISKWEQGIATPDLEHIIKLAEIFEISLDELILAKKPEKIVEDKVMNKWEYKNEAEKRDNNKIGLFIVIVAFVFAIVMYLLAHF